MGDVITYIMLAFGFVGMPLLFFYIIVIKGYQKVKRCSVPMRGLVIDLREEKRVTSDSDGHRSVHYVKIATCQYDYAGKNYESDVEYPSRRYGGDINEYVEFTINPQNPYETYIKPKGLFVSYGFVTVLLLLFVVVGISQIINMAILDKDTTRFNQADTNNNNQIHGNNIDPVDTTNENIITGMSDSSLAIYGELEKKNIEDVLAAKKSDDMSYEYKEKAMLMELNGVSMYIPNTFSLQQKKPNTYTYFNSTTKEEIAITVGYNSRSEDKTLNILRTYASKNYKLGEVDNYMFNGNSFEMYTSTNNKGDYSLVVISVKKSKKLYITYNSGLASTVDFRDVISSIKY